MANDDKFSQFVKVYRGSLAVLGADGIKIIIRSKYSEVSRSALYEIISPFSMSEGRTSTSTNS